MTATRRKNVKRKKGYLILFVAFSFLFIALFHAETMISGVSTAFRLCAETIIPTLFPFMLLSDLIGATISTLGQERNNTVQPGRAVFLLPFFLGALCGFPLGVRSAVDLYRHGEITKEEGDCLLTFVNNTGPAFVIAGVGVQMFSSLQLGILFYTVQILSAILCGILFYRPKASHACRRPSEKSPAFEAPPPFSFLTTVKRCTLSALHITALTAVFSALASLISVFCKNRGLLLFIYSFLEVGGSTLLASQMAHHAPVMAPMLAAFAISFGGCSVHMQALLLLEGTPFSARRYLEAKLLQGILSVVLFLLLSAIF